MCVICVKNKGIEVPSKETFETCFDANPDGAGFMFADNGSVIIKKGFSTFDSFYTAFTKEFEGKDTTNIPIVAHFRIGTHGSKNSPQHTHPFSLCDSYDTMMDLEQHTDIGVCHNGVYHIETIAGGYAKGVVGDRNPSDSMEFIKNLLYPLSLIPGWRDREDVDNIINYLNGFSKLALLDKNGDTTLYGAFEKDANGVFYSNHSYAPIVKVPQSAYAPASYYLYQDHVRAKRELEAWCGKNLSGLEGGYDKIRKNKYQTWFKPAAISYIPTGKDLSDIKNIVTLDPEEALYLNPVTCELLVLDLATDSLKVEGLIVSWEYLTQSQFATEIYRNESSSVR